MYIVSWIQNKMKLQQKHCNQTHQSSVIIIIITTIIASHCSRFTVQRLWEFFFSPVKYAVPIPIRTIPISIPIPIPISSPKLLPFPWESHGNPMGMGIPIPMHTSSSHGPNWTELARSVRGRFCSVERWCEPVLMSRLCREMGNDVRVAGARLRTGRLGVILTSHTGCFLPYARKHPFYLVMKGGNKGKILLMIIIYDHAFLQSFAIWGTITLLHTACFLPQAA